MKPIYVELLFYVKMPTVLIVILAPKLSTQLSTRSTGPELSLLPVLKKRILMHRFELNNILFYRIFSINKGKFSTLVIFILYGSMMTSGLINLN
jgi:hypothetical protein